MDSILSNERVCYVCGTPLDLHKHHVYEGIGRRKTSEKWGCWCYLCGRHHNLSQVGVHFNKQLDTEIKQKCQAKWEEINGSREDFIKIFGRSYLW